MKTRCPGCGTSFEVTQAQLSVRDGKVRCGVCATVFNAFDYAQAEEPAIPVLHSPSLASRDADPRVAEPVHSDPQHARRASAEPRVAAGQWRDEGEVPDDDIEPMIGGAPEPRHIGVHHDATRSGRFAADAPSLSGSGAYSHDARDGDAVRIEGQYRRRVYRETEYDDPEKSSGSGLVWFLATLLALIVLFAQGAIVFRNQLANVAPSLRPKLVQICSFVGCEVGYSRSVRNLVILKPALRNVTAAQAKPEEQSFRLRATIRNNDTIAQPLPSLVLSLKNASESVSARRIISPQQYVLPDVLQRELQPGDEVAIDLPLTTNRTEVAGFELSLFYP